MEARLRWPSWTGPTKVFLARNLMARKCCVTLERRICDWFTKIICLNSYNWTRDMVVSGVSRVKKPLWNSKVNLFFIWSCLVEWESQHQNVVVETRKYVWSYPTIREFRDNLVEMLKNMYPETIPLDQVHEYYKRSYSVLVDTEKYFCRPLRDLISQTYKDKLFVTPEEVIELFRFISFSASRLGPKRSKVIESTSSTDAYTQQKLGHQICHCR